jgi:hypothetical protein
MPLFFALPFFFLFLLFISPLMSPSATDEDYAYVVGIDFGTTYSGCCYAFNNDSMEDFQDITVW